MGGVKHFSLRLLLIAAVLGAWELLVKVFAIEAYILPPPSQVFRALYEGIARNIYPEHLGVTLLETMLGFLLACVLAFSLGILVALSRRVEYFLYPFIVMFQAMPKVALAPLIIVWFGLGLKSKVINAALVAFFPLMVNTIVGLRSAEEDRINLMRSLAANKWQIFWMLQLPNALPYIFAGLEIAMIFALIGAIVAEFIGAERGLGKLIIEAEARANAAEMMVAIFVMMIVGIVLAYIVRRIQSYLLRWQPQFESRA